MKHLKKFALGAITIAIASCSSDEPVTPNQGPENNGNVYATLTVKLPAGGTRAGNQGVEIGKDDENAVGRILVLLATKNADGDYIFLTKSEADASNMGNGSTVPGATGNVSTIKYTLNFSADEMNPNPLGDGSTIPGQQDVYVFAFCNPTTKLKTVYSQLKPGVSKLGESFNDIVAENAEIWQSGKFLMSNCEISAAKTIPSRKDLVDKHNTPENALDLGTIRVKRVAARFDFALGGDNNDNKYGIKDVLDPTKTVGTVELTQMAMFNIAKNFYYLPRTNSQWDWKGTTTLCGDLEGFVMSYDDNFKTLPSLSNARLGEYYHYPVTSLTGLNWQSIKPADWTGKTVDNPQDWTNTDNVDYRIWRYTSENTIPGYNDGKSTGSQKAGISTGVVFKGEFTPVDTELWNGNTVYVYNNVTYGDFNALKAYVSKYTETLVAEAFKKVDAFKDVADDFNHKTSLLTEETNGFKAYTPDANGKYVMYYYYYNRHNTNGDPSVMGENEFGVVRNNVYKLKVTKVGTLGTPYAPKPDDPNEEEKAYFTVSCEVMPWTVRVNNVEF